MKFTKLTRTSHAIINIVNEKKVKVNNKIRLYVDFSPSACGGRVALKATSK